MPEFEKGWLPDLLYRDGRFESGVALLADFAGRSMRFSSEPNALARAKRLAGRAILPALVNAHSHAFQRTIRGRTEHRTGATQDSFWTWREAMYHAANKLSPDDIYHVSRMAFLEMLMAGITTVGEFHYLHHGPDGTPYENPNELAIQVIRAAQDTGMQITLLNAAYVRAGWQKEPNPGQARFITADPQTFIRNTQRLARECSPGSVQVGVAPHSIRAVPLSYLLELVTHARSCGMPIHMHVAEQPAEIEACKAEYGLRPVELLAEHGVLGADFTAVHATHTTLAEIDDLTRAQANICACPTTERNLGDGVGAADMWAQRSMNVCFGSDSNVQIDLLEDARELEYHLRLNQLERAILSSRQLFDYATLGGARSLGVRQPADFFTVDLNDPSIAGADPGSLLSNVVFAAGRGAIRDVFAGGEQVIENGRHAQHDSIVRRFSEVQEKLWR